MGTDLKIRFTILNISTRASVRVAALQTRWQKVRDARIRKAITITTEACGSTPRFQPPRFDADRRNVWESLWGAVGVRVRVRTLEAKQLRRCNVVRGSDTSRRGEQSGGGNGRGRESIG